MRFKRQNINLDKFDRMAELSLKNSLRLHYDAIYLFNRRSYPSAYFLSVLSLEEIGKVLLLGDLIHYSLMNEAEGYPHLDDGYTQHLLSNLYTHKWKQMRFARDASDYHTRLWKLLTSGKLEQQKLNSVYVGLERTKGKINLKGRIKSPFNVKQEKAKKQITIVNDFLIILTLGVVQDQFGLDTPQVEQHLNRKLISKLQRRWKYMNSATKKEYRKLQNLQLDIHILNYENHPKKTQSSGTPRTRP